MFVLYVFYECVPWVHRLRQFFKGHSNARPITLNRNAEYPPSSSDSPLLSRLSRSQIQVVTAFLGFLSKSNTLRWNVGPNRFIQLDVPWNIFLVMDFWEHVSYKCSKSPRLSAAKFSVFLRTSNKTCAQKSMTTIDVPSHVLLNKSVPD